MKILVRKIHLLYYRQSPFQTPFLLFYQNRLFLIKKKVLYILSSVKVGRRGIEISSMIYRSTEHPVATGKHE